MEETGETQFENHVLSWNSFSLSGQNCKIVGSWFQDLSLLNCLYLHITDPNMLGTLGAVTPDNSDEGRGSGRCGQSDTTGWLNPHSPRYTDLLGGDHTDCNVWTYIMIQATKPTLGHSDRHCRLNSVHHAATVLDAKEENCQRRWSVRQHCSQLVPTLTDFLADFPAVFF